MRPCSVRRSKIRGARRRVRGEFFELDRPRKEVAGNAGRVRIRGPPDHRDLQSVVTDKHWASFLPTEQSRRPDRQSPRTDAPPDGVAAAITPASTGLNFGMPSTVRASIMDVSGMSRQGVQMAVYSSRFKVSKMIGALH